jgi:ubiquitin-conjugating enzyme E2 Q
MIFTRSSEIPLGVNDTLEQLAQFSAGMRVPELLTTISQKLQTVLATGFRDAPFSINDESAVEMIDGDGEQSDGDDYEDCDLFSEYGSDDFGPIGRHSSTTSYQLSPETAAKLNRRIREDLRAAKFAGFKLGILSGLRADSQTCLLSISVQVAKLGLSDEAIQAWDLEPQQYIILLMRYSSGYKDFEAVISGPAKSLDIAFRIGVCNRYKPTINEALAAFSDINKSSGKPFEDNSFDATGVDNSATTGFSSLFISSSLNEFINSQFISLLKIRNSMGLSWDGAKHYFNNNQGRLDKQKARLHSFYYDEPALNLTGLSDITADHLVDNRSIQISFPLIAAQFLMRYLLRCTEFCLVCHDKMQDGFEALKPYVCNKPLCLYQYMSLGFGPSVEHEILTQPCVVDLLVSFCYVSAMVSLTNDLFLGNIK